MGTKNIADHPHGKGTVWVTNGNRSMRIPKESVDKYLADGYVQGRRRNNSRVYVRKGDTIHRVFYKYLDKYLAEGYEMIERERNIF